MRLNCDDKPIAEHARRGGTGAAVFRILLVIFIIAVLASVLIPPRGSLLKGQMIQTASNMRQIQIVTAQMAADSTTAEGESIGWPRDLQNSEKNPIRSVPEFVERAVRLGYISRADAGKVFAAPGVKAYSGEGPFKSEHSAFKMYTVSASDPGECVFLATRNFTFGKGLDPRKLPYKDKGCVILRKSGDGLSLRKEQARVTTLVGLMTGATSKDAPGVEEGSVWE